MIHTIQLPQVTTKTDEGDVATFAIEPLHRGFGVTLGNSLRRVLLSSLGGGAVTAFSIEGVTHEFTTLEGVKEDVVEIMLNLKKLRFRVYSDEPQTLQISKKGKGAITAADIEKHADVEVVNTDQHIATLDGAKANFNMTLRVEKGRGYVSVEERKEGDLPVGSIAIDTLFSPVARVRYKVENTRVAQVTDLDRLVIEIATDGTISPQDALQQSAAILVGQFSVIAGAEAAGMLGTPAETIEDESNPELNFSIDDLGLSPRTTNALQNNGISTVRQLIELTESDLKELKGFGAKAHDEVQSKLKELELR